MDGLVTPGFEAVADAFEEALGLDGELGAAFSVVRDGQVVVDLWGGAADVGGGRRWERDTPTVIFSGTKGLAALCLLMLVDRGALDPKAPVSDYWPEFGAAGKTGITVLDLVSHRARLPGIATPVTEEDWIDDRRMAQLLAAQAQDPDPRAADVYHAFTFGWLCGALLRCVDGRSVGRFFAEEVASPLGLDAWIGLPAELEDRVAELAYAPSWSLSRRWDREAFAEDGLLRAVWGNPPVFPADHIPWNRPDYHRAEIPGAGAIATARAMARLYGCLAGGGELDGVRLLSAETLELGRHALVRTRDPLLDGPMALAFGFQVQTEENTFGPPGDAFGHNGAGGSVHCAWPTEGAGVSYAMNTMRDDEPADLRTPELLDAAYSALRASR